MNILFIGHEDKMNGASRCMVEIIDELILQGNQVFVLTAYSDGTFYSELKKRNVCVIVYKFHRWIVNRQESNFRWFLRKNKNRLLIWKDRVAFHFLCEEIKKYKIDIIHSNTSVICIGAWLSSALKIKHVWHLREFGKEDFNMLPIFSEQYTWKYIRKHADCCIAISKAIEKKYRNLIGADKIQVIYDGVIIPENRKKRTYCSDDVNLLLAGRVGEAKGQAEAVSAMIILKSRGYNCFKLFIAGAGDIQKLEQIAGFDTVRDRIVFCGFLDDLNSFREKIDVELICSRAEGFGRVTVEAMMMGNPVIGADTGATAELIRDGENGYLYQKGNVNDLADKIIRLTQNGEYEYLSDTAYDYAHKNFGVKRNVMQICEVYQKLLENSD